MGHPVHQLVKWPSWRMIFVALTPALIRYKNDEPDQTVPSRVLFIFIRVNMRVRLYSWTVRKIMDG